MSHPRSLNFHAEPPVHNECTTILVIGEDRFALVASVRERGHSKAQVERFRTVHLFSRITRTPRGPDRSGERCERQGSLLN